VKVRKGQFDISITVVDNPRAASYITITGEGFSEDLIFEGVQDDDLYFKDNVVGRQQQQTFTMRNVCQNDVRFQWQSHPDFSFSPSIGHIREGQSKMITVSFITDKVVKYINMKVACQWQKIEYENGRAPDWDDTLKTIKYTSRGLLKPTDEILSKSTVIDKKSLIRKPLIKKPSWIDEEKEMVKVVEIKSEPPHTVLPVKTKDLVLKISAISDFIRYSIDTTDIAFSPTMMYEKRIVTARMTNTCQIRFDYTWRVDDFKSLRTNYADVREPAFSISPSSGYIEAGQSTVFYIAFEPQEVDDFVATLKCDIPYISQMRPPSIEVSGFSRRPLCHFNVVLSDYISAGRRHPDYTDPLPDDIRVIELFSNGTGSVAKKRFEVINPTSSSYEIEWTPISSGKSPITCDTPSALLSSGKRYTVSFSYLPTSVKTVEARWLFQIPEHQVGVKFLFVGRILPH
jgi:hydrocephalus-inducing protein